MKTTTERTAPGLARRALLPVALVLALMLALATPAIAAEGEEPLPAGPSEEYSQDPSDVVGDPSADEPVPAGPSEEYAEGEADVVGEPAVEEPMLPYTEAIDPAAQSAPEAFLPFTGGDASLLVIAGFSALAGLATRRMGR